MANVDVTAPLSIAGLCSRPVVPLHCMSGCSYMGIYMRRVAIIFIGVSILLACAKPTVEPPVVSEKQLAQIEHLMAEHQARSLGIGLLEAGRLVWTGYFGERAPGEPVDQDSMFNTASMSKAVTAELAIRLVEQEVIDLDEPIHAYYVHPDLEEDPRHRQLTPRILLTHTSGFLNWPSDYDNGKLAFTRDPGVAYGYSGVGFDIFAMFLEAKLGKSFPELVTENIFEPFAMQRATQLQAQWMHQYRVQPLTADGQFAAVFPLDDGYWNPADDLFVTVEDYAEFLLAVQANVGAGDLAKKLRSEVQTDLSADPLWGCQFADIPTCPEPYGHSIGYFVFGFGERLNIQHGGNDISEAATGYFDQATGDGMIVFVNAPNPQGLLLYLKVVELLDEEQKFTAIFNSIIARYFSD